MKKFAGKCYARDEQSHELCEKIKNPHRESLCHRCIENVSDKNK